MLVNGEDNTVLTKDLIRYRTYKGALKPQFIDITNQQLLKLAEQLLAFYKVEQGASRTEIAEMVMGVVNSAKDIKLAKGLNKLILDGCEFSHVGEHNYRSLRKDILTYSAQLLKEKMDYTNFLKQIYQKYPTTHNHLSDIYADHPDNEKLISCRDLTPQKLLIRYNNALVQSLLIHSETVFITLQESDTAKLRRLFKYLKFFRLLATISYQEQNKKILEIRVDGPGSIFENINKYGLQLASFFPALCDMAKWAIESSVTVRNKKCTLSLDQTSKLQNHYSTFSAYIPEEIRLFHTLFSEQIEEWHILEEIPFLKGEGGAIIFPDLSFKHQSGKVVHLELFHRWHGGQLLKRLSDCEKQGSSEMIIGVDRSIGKTTSIKEALEKSVFFTERGFLFRDFPSITQIKKILKSMIE